MNHTQILKRSWKILWSYKTLWIFGILLALVSGGGGGGSGGSNASNRINNNNNNNGDSFNLPPAISQEFDKLGKMFQNGIPPEITGTLVTIAIALVCLFLIMIVVNCFLRYISETSLIHMVDKLEATGEKVGWRQGFRLGWSRGAWRLFLIDLLISLPMTLIFFVLFFCALIPIFVSSGFQHEPSILTIIASVGLIFLLIFVTIIVSTAINIILNFIRRACVLRGLGVFQSIREGWLVVRTHLKDVLLMWLLLVGVQLLYGVLMIPVVLLLLVIGGMFGGGVGLLIYVTSQSIIAAVIVGVVILFFLMGLPSLFIEGLMKTFLSTNWTLAYREIVVVAPPEEIEPPVVLENA